MLDWSPDYSLLSVGSDKQLGVMPNFFDASRKLLHHTVPAMAGERSPCQCHPEEKGSSGVGGRISCIGWFKVSSLKLATPLSSMPFT